MIQEDAQKHGVSLYHAYQTPKLEIVGIEEKTFRV
jgi:hypothetical protein